MAAKTTKRAKRLKVAANAKLQLTRDAALGALVREWGKIRVVESEDGPPEVHYVPGPIRKGQYKVSDDVLQQLSPAPLA